jgi:hypothetical protein
MKKKQDNAAVEQLAKWLAAVVSSPNGQFMLEILKKYDINKLLPYIEQDEDMQRANREGISFGELIQDKKRYLAILERALEKSKQESYSTTLQGAVLNQLRQIGKRAGENSLFENDTIIYDGDNVKLGFYKSSKYKGQAMTVPMQKVLSMYHEELCKIAPANLEDLGEIKLKDLGKYSKVRITRDKYMELTKTKDRKTADKTIDIACDRLYEISFCAAIDRGGKDTEIYKGRLFQSQALKLRGGVYEMEFSNDFLRYCATTTPQAFHNAMYQINGNNNPYSWGLGQKLRQHYELNRGKRNQNRLSVKKLLAAVPDIPTYSEVRAGARDVNRRIIEPVERDLDELVRLDIVKRWEYSNAKGAPLTADQLKGIEYQQWEKLYITFELNLPPQAKFIEAHKKKIEAAKKRAARKK